MTKYKKKLRLQKNTIFLKLMQKYRAYDIGENLVSKLTYKMSFSFLSFKNYYIIFMRIFYIFYLMKYWQQIKSHKSILLYNIFGYYATINYYNNSMDLAVYKNFVSSKKVNMIIFSRPLKQLFLMIYKNKPVFIFTGGLMRIVMHEKRKSSRKIYKVAVSLIKLCTILLLKKNFFPQGYLKLINVGGLRVKIIKSLLKLKPYTKINYILIKFRQDFNSQKFETRRAIKKYIKKRFKIR